MLHHDKSDVVHAVISYPFKPDVGGYPEAVLSNCGRLFARGREPEKPVVTCIACAAGADLIRDTFRVATHDDVHIQLHLEEAEVMEIEFTLHMEY